MLTFLISAREIFLYRPTTCSNGRPFEWYWFHSIHYTSSYPLIMRLLQNISADGFCDHLNDGHSLVLSKFSRFLPRNTSNGCPFERDWVDCLHNASSCPLVVKMQQNISADGCCDHFKFAKSLFRMRFRE